MQSRSRLLVFTLGAPEERARRPLLPASQGLDEIALREACLDRLLEAGQALGCEIHVASARPIARAPRRLQQGRGSFGSRLARAFGQVFAEDDAPLVVVGTDTPDLGGEQIRAALDLLAGHPERVVLGPSPDGGLYLLAATRDLSELLRDAPWQRSDTRRRLRALLLARGLDVVELEPLRDLDRPGDLVAWLATSALSGWTAWRAHLRRLLARVGRKGLAAPILADSYLFASSLAGRAPPG